MQSNRVQVLDKHVLAQRGGGGGFSIKAGALPVAQLVCSAMSSM